ncbi:ABC transporter ATP-binding protein [Candidatus Woesearchaeota archaeon]|nr:ABC transporter ATP-binding protein [Candidatus Woesearchaeota archaeon]
MNKSMIEIRNVKKRFVIPHEKTDSLKVTLINLFRRKTFETFYAVDDISFEIKEGEFVGIIGRNGSGKSTLLKLLAGIYHPDSGEINIKGDISPFLELGVGFNGELSGRDNVYLYGAVLGLTKKEIDDKLKDILEFSELERFIDQKLKNYSSGMQVRLAFSVAIQSYAPIFLVDEALAVGDIKFQDKCYEVFRRFKKQGKTIILVSHDYNVMKQFCDKGILLENGKVIGQGKINTVVDKYLAMIKNEEKSGR